MQTAITDACLKPPRMRPEPTFPDSSAQGMANGKQKAKAQMAADKLQLQTFQVRAPRTWAMEHGCDGDTARALRRAFASRRSPADA